MHPHPQNKNSRIASSAMGYAIAFLLLVGCICSGMLFISSANKRLELVYTMQEHILMDNIFALRYCTKNGSSVEKLIIHPAGDSSKIRTKSWGVFQVASASTFHKQQSIHRDVLFGWRQKEELPALYYPDQSRPLKIAGSALLQGAIFGPTSGIEQAYIAEKFYTRKQLYEGAYSHSHSALPSLAKDLNWSAVLNWATNADKLKRLPEDSVFTFAGNPSVFEQIESFRIDGNLRGNLILHSFDSIVVGANAHLENVIVIAPKIHFETGFRGYGQFIAEHQITTEKNVQLTYPSILAIFENKKHGWDKRSSIVLGDNTTVLGGVLLQKTENTSYNAPYLQIPVTAKIAGLIYNSGDTELFGECIGHVYTQQFVSNFGGSSSTHVLVDGRISSVQLPKDFIFPNWIASHKAGEPAIMEWM